MPPVRRSDRRSVGCGLAPDAGGAQARQRSRRDGLGGGTSTLDLIGRNPHLFEVVALTAHNNVEALAELALRHRAAVAVVAEEPGMAPSGSCRGAASRWRPVPPPCSLLPCGRPIASWQASSALPDYVRRLQP